MGRFEDMPVPRLAALLGVVALLAGCGGTGPERDRSAQARAAAAAKAERQWIDNAGRLIDDLNESVLLSASGGSTVASARKALHDDSDLYGLIVAHSRFGACEQTLLNAGAPGARLRAVDRTLTAACRRLEHASVLFTVSMKHSDPNALLAATRTALGTTPLLERARAQLDAGALFTR
jgi:hypothetical protein